MRPIRSVSPTTRLVLAVLVCGLGVRAPYFFAGADAQLALLSDDACYYLEAARRTVETRAWPSMDGAHPTNGFHPLYFVILVGIQAAIGTDVRQVVPLVFAFGLICNVAAVGVLVHALRRRLSGGAALVAVAIVAASPGFMAHGLAGVENGLSSILVLLAVSRWIARFEPAALGIERGIGVRGGWWLDGALLGLAMTARTDSVVFAGFYVAGALVVRARRGERSGPIARDLVLCAGVATLAVAPWLGANLARFGTIEQDSAVALATRFDRLHGEIGTPGWLALAVRNLGFWVYRLSWGFGLVPLAPFLAGYALPAMRLRRIGARPATALLGIACAAAISVRVNDTWAIDSPSWAAVELALAALGCALGLAVRRENLQPAWCTQAFLYGWTAALALGLAAGLRSFQLWYTTAPTVAAVLWLGLPALAHVLRGRRALAVVLCGLVLLQAGSRLHRYTTRGTLGTATADLIASGEALASRLERLSAADGLRLGSFDSGLLSYRVHPFPIANLDGVMNHAAAGAIRDDTFALYLRDSGLTHVATDSLRLREFMRVSPFAAELDTAATRRAGITLFRILDRVATEDRAGCSRPGSAQCNARERERDGDEVLGDGDERVADAEPPDEPDAGVVPAERASHAADSAQDRACSGWRTAGETHARTANGPEHDPRGERAGAGPTRRPRQEIVDVFAERCDREQDHGPRRAHEREWRSLQVDPAGTRGPGDDGEAGHGP